MRTLLINMCYWLLTYNAFVQGKDSDFHILEFIISIFFLMSLLMLTDYAKIAESVKSRKLPPVRYLSYATQFALTLILLWYGHVILSFMTLITFFIMSSFKNEYSTK